MSIIIPASRHGIVTPRRHGLGFGGGGDGLNILNRQWGDAFLPGPSYALSGRIKVDVLDAASGIMLRLGRWMTDPILNCGLDHIASYAFAACFAYGHLSTDTATPVVTDTTMAGYAKTNTAYGSGDGATTVSGDTITLTRSFVFAAETSTATYTKFYTSPTSGSSATPFSETLLENPLFVLSGQQAKVTFSLSVTVTPHTTAKVYGPDLDENGDPIPGTGNVISGANGSTGTARIPVFFCSLSSIDGAHFCYISSNGVTQANSSYAPILEPSNSNQYHRLLVSTASVLSAAAESGTGMPASYNYTLGGTVTLQGYSSGSFSRVKTVLADLSDCNISGIRIVGLAKTNGLETCGFQFLSATAFSKLNTQKLSMNFTFTWGRAE